MRVIKNKGIEYVDVSNVGFSEVKYLSKGASVKILLKKCTMGLDYETSLKGAIDELRTDFNDYKCFKQNISCHIDMLTKIIETDGTLISLLIPVMTGAFGLLIGLAVYDAIKPNDIPKYIISLMLVTVYAIISVSVCHLYNCLILKPLIKQLSFYRLCQCIISQFDADNIQ